MTIEEIGLAKHAFDDMIKRLKEDGFLFLGDYPSPKAVNPDKVIRHLKYKNELRVAGESLLYGGAIYDATIMDEKAVIAQITKKISDDKIELINSEIYKK